mgnify:CR=1 FL=1
MKKSTNRKNKGCGFVTFTKNIATTPSGTYRVKVSGKTVTCKTKTKAYQVRKELLALKNA